MPKGYQSYEKLTVELLPSYDPAASCSKCGHEYVSSAYMNANCSSSWGYVRRRCVRCNFTWAEEPLDTPAKRERKARLVLVETESET